MNIYIFPVLIFFFSLSGVSQGEFKKIYELKISIISNKLDLTEKEAREFWPIYKDFGDKTHKLKIAKAQYLKNIRAKDIKTINDDDAKDLLNKLMIIENDLLDEKKQLILKLRRIITPKKILLLLSTEEDFKRKLLNRFKKQIRKTNIEE